MTPAERLKVAREALESARADIEAIEGAIASSECAAASANAKLEDLRAQRKAAVRASVAEETAA